MMLTRIVFIAALAAAWLVSCKKAEQPPATAEKGGAGMALMLTSSAFEDGAAIPRKFTCDGEDKSPPLTWTGIPEGTKSLALICDDPDAPMGTWVHWVVWNIPPSAPGLPEGVPAEGVLPGGIKQGLNSWPRTGYGGPCPPPGKPHRYYFKLYALNADLVLPDTTNKAGLEFAVKDKILAEVRLMGTYGR